MENYPQTQPKADSQIGESSRSRLSPVAVYAGAIFGYIAGSALYFSGGKVKDVWDGYGSIPFGLIGAAVGASVIGVGLELLIHGFPRRNRSLEDNINAP